MTAPVAPLRQPVEDIHGAETALRVILTDPSDVPTTIYGRGYLDGALLGHAWSVLHVFTDAQAAELDRMYAVDVVPLRLAKALDAGLCDEKLRATGWHQGFADLTEFDAEAWACGTCNRRLFADLHDVWSCERMSEVLCRGLPTACASVCEGPGHRECHDEIRQP